jgi:hypothetical protein
MDIPKSFISIIILFHEAFKYGDGVKFWGYVGINIEPLSVELLNNVREVYRLVLSGTSCQTVYSTLQHYGSFKWLNICPLTHLIFQNQLRGSDERWS